VSNESPTARTMEARTMTKNVNIFVLVLTATRLSVCVRSVGPHKARECLPLCLILRNRLKYALTYKEVTTILMQRVVKVDGKVRMDKCFPCGIMGAYRIVDATRRERFLDDDRVYLGLARARRLTETPFLSFPFITTDVVSIEKSDEHFRLIYDHKGRFVVQRIDSEQAQYKLCKVKSKKLGDKGVPCVGLHDGRTIRYPDPLIKEGDTVVVDIASNKITDFVKFDVGSMCMITGGRNAGRVGVVQRREKHIGSFEIVHLKDAAGQEFATRATNVFVIGTGNKPLIRLPKGKGIKLSIIDERAAHEA